MHTIDDKKLLLLRPSDIKSPKELSRRHFDEYELHALASDILSNGIIEPLCVRKEGKDRYVLISGERRLRAAKTAGLRRVPCVVHKADEREAAIFSLVENLSRSPLDYFEEAMAIERLMFSFSMSKREISERLGKPPAAIQKKLKLLKIPEDMRIKILSANLSEAHAEVLSTLDKKDIPLILDAAISESLSASQIKELILSPPAPEPEAHIKTAPVRKTAIGDIKLFSNSLTKLLLTMQNSGHRTNLIRKETDGFVEYKIRIEKTPTAQLSFSGL